MSEAMLAALPAHVRRFAALPYPAGGGLYDKGPEDLLVVSACAVAWTVLRHVSMNYVLSPLADAVIPHESIPKSAARTPALLRHEQRLVAKRRKHNVERFAEQAWGMAYCTVFWSIGLVSPVCAVLPAPQSERAWDLLCSLAPGFAGAHTSDPR